MIILVNGHIINVYRHTTSNPDKINWEELKPVLSCLSAEVEFIVAPRDVRERCNFCIKRSNKSYSPFSPRCAGRLFCLFFHGRQTTFNHEHQMAPPTPSYYPNSKMLLRRSRQKSMDTMLLLLL